MQADEYVLSMTWITESACLGMRPEIFHPVKGDKEIHAKIAAARKVCFSCDVRLECLHYALSTRQRFGVWGGETERQRRQLRLRYGYSTPRATRPAKNTEEGITADVAA